MKRWLLKNLHGREVATIYANHYIQIQKSDDDQWTLFEFRDRNSILIGRVWAVDALEVFG